MPRNRNWGWHYARVPANRRAKRGYRVEYMHGRSWTFDYFSWTHYDLACDYLQRGGHRPINDVGEVLVNFSEAELREIIAQRGATKNVCDDCDKPIDPEYDVCNACEIARAEEK